MEKKFKKRKNKITIMLTISVLTISLSGCGRKNEDELKAEYSSGTSEVSATQSPSVETGEIPETVNVQLSGTSIDTPTTIDAEVVSEGYNQMPIYEETFTELTDDYMKQLGEQVFDNGEYEIVKPYYMCNADEIEQEKERINELIKNQENIPPYIFNDMAAINELEDSRDESQVGEAPKDKIIFDDSCSNIVYGMPEVYTKRGRLRGEIDGVPWEINAYCGIAEGIGENVPTSSYEIVAYPIDTNKFFSDNVSMDSVIKNSANVDKSQSKADEIIEKFGFKNKVPINTYQCYLKENVEELNGYEFVYTSSVNGINVLSNLNGSEIDSGVVLANSESEGKHCTAFQQNVYVKCNNDYVGYIKITPGYEIGEAMSDAGTMLSFDKIEEKAEQYIDEVMNSDEPFKYYGSTCSYEISRIELMYVNIEYENGKVALVPTWVYWGYPTGWVVGSSLTPVVGVTAIDGSAIQFNIGEVY